MASGGISLQGLTTGPPPPLGPVGYTFPPTPPTLPDEETQQRHAWQYQGYPGYAAWMASSNDFFVLRRFAQLNARYLLYLQHQIATYEEKLNKLDASLRERPLGKGVTGSFEDEEFSDRTELLRQSGPLLKEYYELINAYAQVRSRPTAESHHLRNLKNWFITYPDAIKPAEQHHLDAHGNMLDGDLFPVIPRRKSPLRWFLHKSRRMRQWFSKKDRSDHVHTAGTRYHSDTGFDNMVCAVTVGLGLGLLFAPMWYLHYVHDATYMLGIITGFVSLFAFWLWVAAGPRQFEILLGTAAYAAVLYIYLQAAKDPHSDLLRGHNGHNSTHR